MIRVLRHQVVRGWLPLALVGLVTAGLTLLAVAWPRALDRLVRADLVAQAQELAVTQRDLAAAVPQRRTFEVVPGPAEAAALLAEAAASVAATVSDAGPEVAEVLGEPEHEVTRAPFYLERTDAADGVSYLTLEVSVGPRLADLELVEGSWPAGPDTTALTGVPVREIPPPVTLEVVLTEATAEWMAWPVGQERASLDPRYPVTVRLAGLVAPVDPGSGTWAHLPGALDPVVDRNDSAGWTVHGVAWADPTALPALTVPLGVELRSWYPVDPVAVGEADADALAAGLAGLRAADGLRTDLSTVLATSAGRDATVSRLLGVLVAGVVAAGGGLAWLVARLAAERRRPELALLAARGASRRALVGLVAAQGALAALPGGLTGIALGRQVPGQSGATDLIVAGTVVVGVIAVLVLAAGPAPNAPGRGRWRWAAEALVAAVTALTLLSPATWLAAIPLLVSLSAALVAVRLQPVPARAALRAAGRGRDLGTLLGTARAARLPAGGLVPVVALTVGLATAGLAVTAATTTARATGRSAALAVGADLRLDLTFRPQGAGLDEAALAAARAADGVAALAAVADAGSTTVHQDRTRVTVRVLVVDGTPLAAVQGEPAAAVEGTRALVAPGLPTGTVRLDAPNGPLALEAHRSAALAGVTTGSGWLVVDRATWAAAGGSPPADRLLVRLTPGADAEAVAEAIAAAVGAPLAATTLADARAEITDGVLVAATRSWLVGLAAVGLALVVAVLAVVLVAGGPTRSRAAAVLATLGAPARVHRRLVTAEVVGPVLLAAVAGALAGAVLAPVVLGVADLRPFTGATTRPPVVADPVVLAAIAAGLAAVLAVGIRVAGATARRVRPVDVLRAGPGG